MKKPSTDPRPALALLALVAAALLAAAPDGRAVLEKTLHRQTYRDAVLRVQIEKTKKGADRSKTISMIIYQKTYPDMINTLVQIEAPDVARGISFLTWDYKNPATPDEKWYYLPQIKRYQKLDEGAGAKYEDQFGFSMDIFAVNLDAADHVLLGEETVGGVACWKVESKTKKTGDPMGARIVTWVRKPDGVPAQLQAFDAAGNKIRDFHITGVKNYGIFVMETGGVYVDELKGRTTTFQILDAKFDTGLSDDQFISAKLEEKAKALRQGNTP